MSIRDEITETSQTVAGREFRSFIERIERLEQERKTIADDIGEVFKELKGRGFDKESAKIVLKIRRSDGGMAAYEERSTIVDLYLAAMNMIPDEPEARAPARTRENIEEFRLTSRSDAGADNTMRHEQIATDLPLHDADGVILEEQAAAESAADEMHQRPSTNDEPSPEAGPQAEASHCQDTGVGTLADREGHLEGEAVSASLPTNSLSAAPTPEQLSAPEATRPPEVSGATLSSAVHMSRSATPVADGGQPSKLSSDAGGAKMGEAPAFPERVAATARSIVTKSEQAANFSTDDIPAFLKGKADCLDHSGCKVKFTSALCSRCANERAKARAAA